MDKCVCSWVTDVFGNGNSYNCLNLDMMLVDRQVNFACSWLDSNFWLLSYAVAYTTKMISFFQDGENRIEICCVTHITQLSSAVVKRIKLMVNLD